MRTNFTQCKTQFNETTLGPGGIYHSYDYTGPVRGLYSYLDNKPLLITNAGCNAVCGRGADLYSWQDASATISTWVLPILGLIIQAPYESNEFLSTLLFMARMVGSPIATMAYILWNIKVSGMCALYIDMSTKYDNYPGNDSQFEQMRDSFYLLSVMNQYSVKQKMPRTEAERLLRIALWSDSLQLEVVEDESRSLVKRRRKLARTIRESRKRGVVPVFISLMWFLFSLIVSLQAAFGQLGQNATAHNLALGLLLAWLPSLILFSVVDRNPIAADAIRIKFNRLLDATRRALLDPSLRDTYIREVNRPQRDFEWTEKLRDEDYFREDFFTRFSGQGRVRWHYGVAPSILAGIEKTQIPRYGRDWLQDSEKARTLLVKGPEKLYGLHWFDRRSIWPVLASLGIIGASFLGAFIISYFTPTVGLGCRSGGYLIYLVLAQANMMIEGACWVLISEGSMVDRDPLTRIGSNIDRRLSSADGYWKITARITIHASLRWWQQFTARDKIERLILRPLDVINSLWLSYIVLSQVFGFYRTCDCQCSIWTSMGGYMDFESYDFYRGIGVSNYWGGSTAVSLVAMSLAFAYSIIEWGQQSHMSTDNYESAQKGLKATRKFRRSTEAFHKQRHHVERTFVLLWTLITRLLARNGINDPSLDRLQMVWTSRDSEKPATQTPRLPRGPTFHLEEGTAMSRDNSRSSESHELSQVKVTPATSGLGLSLQAPSASTTRPHPSHSRSPASSLGEQDWAGATSVPMSREVSHSRSSHSIDRKPLLSHQSPSLGSNSSPDIGHYRSPSFGFNEQAWASLMQEDGSSDSHALVEEGAELPAIEQSHARAPRMSYGEHDLHPPAPIPRSSPRMSGVEADLGSPRSMPRSSPRVSGGERDLDLPMTIPRDRAY